MNKKLTFILGGVRSGKSSFAVKLASELSERVLYIATGIPIDEEMKERIEKHRKSRPEKWKTIEEEDIVSAILKHQDHKTILIDCLNFFISNMITDQEKPENSADKIIDKVKELLNVVTKTNSNAIIVGNEVGMGVVPPYPLGRFYRDITGYANQLVAKKADEVYFVMAGIPLKIKG
jgi:adenosylcobinamide kinase/adenosylcobinamide-phosphate guanylyltransferase